MNEILNKIDELEKDHAFPADNYGLGYIKALDDIKAIIQAKQKSAKDINIPTKQEDPMKAYYQAREVIKRFCQNEDCTDDCEDCQYPLSTIRCEEEAEYEENISDGKRKTKGDVIRESNENLANAIVFIQGKLCDTKGNFIECCMNKSNDKCKTCLLEFLNQSVESGE